MVKTCEDWVIRRRDGPSQRTVRLNDCKGVGGVQAALCLRYSLLLSERRGIQGKGTGLKSSAGKEDPVELDSNLVLCSDIRDVE